MSASHKSTGFKDRPGSGGRGLPEARKGFATRFVSENESTRLTNGMIALAIRLITSSVVGMVRLFQRNRSSW